MIQENDELVVVKAGCEPGHCLNVEVLREEIAIDQCFYDGDLIVDVGFGVGVAIGHEAAEQHEACGPKGRRPGRVG